MATQFYLTLASNSSLEYFPDNTVANFKVKLAEPIELTWEWEVALAEIHYHTRGVRYEKAISKRLYIN